MKKLILIISFILLIAPSLTLAALININTADATELDKIPGVGPSIANLIVGYRNTNGDFKTIEEIQKVKWIGPETFLEMKDYITVGEIPSSGNGGNTSDNNNSENRENNGSSGGGSSNESLSVHTGDTVLGSYKKEDFKISAGRERLATVKTPLIFTAISNRRGENTTSFIWNFGDGTSTYGERVTHTYQFPGQYNVILNARLDQKEEATARTVVIVTEAKIKITNLDFSLGFIELTNYSEQEQNLNHWLLKVGDKNYIFPLDTIVSPKISIKVPLKLIGLDNPNVEEVVLFYPDGSMASGAQKESEISVKKKIARLQSNIVELKSQQAVNSSVINLPEASPRAGMNLGKDGKNVVVLKKEPTWFEKIKHAIFK